MTDFSAFVAALADDCARDLAEGRDWRHRIGRAPEGFLEWARDHKKWSLTYAEAAGEVCAKPPEAAAYVLLKIIEEELEDRAV